MGATQDIITGQSEQFLPNGFFGIGKDDRGFSYQSAGQ
jgi:hypothetical protein